MVCLTDRGCQSVSELARMDTNETERWSLLFLIWFLVFSQIQRNRNIQTTQ